MNKYSWKDKNILIVEDEEYVCKFLERILLRTGANVLWARNGLAAVEMCKTDLKIDVVLMDMKLPELNGYEAVKRIKAFNKNLKIIAQTAYAMAEDKDLCLEAGCDDYICKPIDPVTLLDKIHAAMNN
jgi:two-component system, cell cycle response regulator DivK